MAFKHILVPTDFGDASLGAADLAIDMAHTDRASLTLVHTCELRIYTYPGMSMGGTDLPMTTSVLAPWKMNGGLVSKSW